MNLTGATVVITNINALGTGLITMAGGTLQDNGGGLTISNPILLGTGTNTIFATSGNFTLSGNIGGSGTLAKGLATLAGVLPSNSAGTLVLTSPETYTGATTVNQGSLVLAGNGTAIQSSGFTVNVGATLQLDNTSTFVTTAANNVNRLGDTATLVINGGTFTYVGASNAISAETLGNVTIGAGNDTINPIATGTGSALLTFGTLTATTAGGTINFVAGSAGAQTLGGNVDQIIFTQTLVATLTGTSIIKRAIITDQTSGLVNLATATSNQANTAASVVALTTYASLSTTGTNLATDNVLVTASPAALTVADAFNSILVRGDGITLSGAFTLTPSTGMFVIVDTGSTGNTLSTAIPNFGANEGVFITANPAGTTGTATISSVIPATSTGGVTLAGSGTINLAGANLYTGATNITSGTVQLGASATATPFAATAVTIIGGTLLSNFTQTLASAITLSTGAVSSGATINVANTFTLTLTGAIAGTGSLTKTNFGTLAFGGAAANTFTGITTVNLGTVNLSETASVAAIGGSLVINGGGTVNATTVEPLMLAGAGTDYVAVNNGGTLSAASGVTLQVGGTTGVLVLNGGTVSGAGAVALNAGTGVPAVVLSSANPSTISVTTFELQTGATGITRPFIVLPGTGAAINQELTISSVIANTNNATSQGTGITKLGTGTMIFAGAAANTFGNNATTVGLTSVNEGTLQFSKTAAVADIGNGNLVVGAFSGSGTLQVTTNFNQLNTVGLFVNTSSNGGGVANIVNSTSTQTVGQLQLDGGTLNTGGNTITLGGNVIGVASGLSTGTVQSVFGGVTSAGTIPVTGAIKAVTVSAGGTGYTNGEAVTFTGGTGSGAREPPSSLRLVLPAYCWVSSLPLRARTPWPRRGSPSLPVRVQPLRSLWATVPTILPRRAWPLTADSVSAAPARLPAQLFPAWFRMLRWPALAQATLGSRP